MHCIPLEDSRRLHEDAVRKYYNDSLIYVREQVILSLEHQLSKRSKYYEELLSTSAQVNDQRIAQNVALQKTIQSLQTENKSVRKRLRWSNFKTAGVGILGVVAVILVSGQ